MTWNDQAYSIQNGPPPPPVAKESFGVFLSRPQYVVAKIGIWCFHALCGTYFVAAGLLYRELATTKLAGMLQLYSLTVRRKYMSVIGTMHSLVAVLFGWYLIQSLWKLLSRRLCKSKTDTKDVAQRSFRAVIASVPFPGSSTRIWKLVSRIYDIVFAPNGLLGVENNHFETYFVVRELTETVLQTYQAYVMSRLLPRAGLNRFYVVVLVLNCWSTPLFYRFSGRNKAFARLLSLLCDILLDFVSAIGVPVWLALDYLPHYNVQSKDFPLSYWYNDAWIVRFMNDAPLMVMGNWLATVSRLLFSISLLSTLGDISALLKLKSTSVCPSTQSPQPPQFNMVKPMATRLVHAAHTFMVLFGAGILGVQLYAESRPTPHACVLVVRPWMVSEPACALIEINCLTTPTLTSNRIDFDAITGPLDRFSLEHLVVRHCHQVEFTPHFQAFQNLIGMKTYNSTFVTWNTSAAITKTHHPRMRFLFLVHTRFPNGTLPPGLTPYDFPSTLKDIEISGSNLNWLPDDLHDRWPQQLTLFLEYGELTSFPLVLTRLNPRMLSLCGNHITRLPPEAFLLPAAYTIAFTANPLTELPTTGVDPKDVYTLFVFLDSTNVSIVPEWMDKTFLTRTQVFVGGSPFCVDVLGNETSTERAQVVTERPYLATAVDCTEVAPQFQPFYPQYLEVRDDETKVD